MVPENEFMDLLHESGVANEFAHWEDGEFVTAITSKDELRKLVELAYREGLEKGSSWF